MSNTQIYYTHDNGARPFKVEIISNNVNVYKEIPTPWDSGPESDIESESKYLWIMTHYTKKIFVGKSKFNKMTDGHGSEFDGNTILLGLEENIYKFIGDKMFLFTAHEEIVEYNSPVGKNDVPYPYAVDKHKNIYLLNESVVIKYSNHLQDNLNKYSNNPYNYYYCLSLITPDFSTSPPMMPVINCFAGIKEYYIDQNPHIMRFVPNPEKDFFRLESLGKMYVVDTNEKKIELTKDEYILLMKKFGEKICVEPLRKKDKFV